MGKPTILLVPGSFCPSQHYDPNLTALRARSTDYSIQTVELRTVGKRPGPLPTMYDDADHINAEAGKLADEGKDVILVAHSYGGVPTSQSIKGVSKAEREKVGKKGGVVRVAYMAALVPELGGSAASLMAGGENMTYVAPDEDGWLYHVDMKITAPIVFSSLSPEDALERCKEFSTHSGASFANELTNAGYLNVPASYLFSEKDQCVLPKVQQRGIDNIEKATGRKVDVTRIAADHCPEVSVPETVLDWWVHLIELGGKE